MLGMPEMKLTNPKLSPYSKREIDDRRF